MTALLFTDTMNLRDHMLNLIKRLFQGKMLAPQTEEIIKKYDVKLVVFFGSQVTGYTHPESDIDIGVVFGAAPKDMLKSYAGIEDALRPRFKKKARIQIVDLETTPLSLRFKAIENGKLLYAESAKYFVSYREKSALEYFDFKPVEDYCKKVFLGQTL